MHKSVFYNLIRGIAANLPGEWQFDERSKQEGGVRCSAALTGREGRRLLFRERWEKESMVSVSCGWPTLDGSVFDPHKVGALHRGDKHLGMNFTSSRSARSIANDISRRLLDSYDALYVACVEARDKRVERIELVRDQCVQLLRSGGLSERVNSRHYDGEVCLSRHVCSSMSCYYRVSTFNGESRIELSGVPMDLAIKIASLIDTHCDTGNKK